MFSNNRCFHYKTSAYGGRQLIFYIFYGAYLTYSYTFNSNIIFYYILLFSTSSKLPPLKSRIDGLNEPDITIVGVVVRYWRCEREF